MTSFDGGTRTIHRDDGTMVVDSVHHDDDSRHWFV
jgi:hypothetical protein